MKLSDIHAVMNPRVGTFKFCFCFVCFCFVCPFVCHRRLILNTVTSYSFIRTTNLNCEEIREGGHNSSIVNESKKL